MSTSWFSAHGISQMTLRTCLCSDACSCMVGRQLQNQLQQPGTLKTRLATTHTRLRERYTINTNPWTPRRGLRCVPRTAWSARLVSRCPGPVPLAAALPPPAIAVQRITPFSTPTSTPGKHSVRLHCVRKDYATVNLIMLKLSRAAARRGGSPWRWTGTGSFPVNGVVQQGTSLQHPNRPLGTRERQHRAVLGQQAEMGTRQTEPSETTLQLWRTADAVCFDVDSTFCSDESIDEVARFLGLHQDVKRITDDAMKGEMPFEVALRERLELMKPSQDAFARFMADHPAKLSDGIEDLVRKLRARRVAVYLLSGGFRIIIHPIADSLGIPVPSHVYANAILFNDDGSYRTFDEKEYTSRAGGKAEAIEHIKKQHGHKVVAMVGDGATDLEARRDGAADIFIGYGGSVYRDNIADAADWYVTSIKALTAELD